MLWAPTDVSWGSGGCRASPCGDQPLASTAHWRQRGQHTTEPPSPLIFRKLQKRWWHWQQLGFVGEEDVTLISPLSPGQYLICAFSVPCGLVSYFCSFGMKWSSVVPHPVHQFRSRMFHPGLSAMTVPHPFCPLWVG